MEINNQKDLNFPFINEKEEKEEIKFIQKNSIQENETFTKKKKKILTATYCSHLLTLGLAVGATGPTLISLSKTTNSTIESMGSLFTSRGLGWLLGSMISGKLFEKVKKNHIILATSLFFMVIYLIILPFITNYWFMMFISALVAIGMSFIEVGTNILTISLWLDESGPYMQFLHFCFGAGATISPFIVGLLITLFLKEDQKIPSGLWTYWILGIFSFIIAILTIIQKSPPLKNNQNKDKENENENNNFSNSKILCINFSLKNPKIKYFVIVTLLSIYLFLYVGSESSYGGWIAAYAIKVYHLSESEGAYLSSGFWGAITIFRGIAVFLSIKLSPQAMLSINMIGCMLSVIILIIFESYKNRILLWIITLIFGSFMASMYATTYSLPIQMNIVLTSQATAFLVVGGSLGDMLVPMIVGWFMNIFNSTALPWSIFFMFIFATIIFIVVLYGLTKTGIWFWNKKNYQVMEQLSNNNNNERDGESLNEYEKLELQEMI